MTGDIGLFPLHDGTFRSDFQVISGDLVSDNGLRTACYLSIFTDRRVEKEELTDGETSLRGWWGDAFPEIEGDLIGSRFWLLRREKQTLETLNRAMDYSREALQWLIDDGVASSLDVDAVFNAAGFLILTILIYEPSGKKSFQFSSPWAVEGSRGNS